MNPQPLPKVLGRTDYQRQLHILKKIHRMAADRLNNVRSKSAEWEADGEKGFYSYKSNAISACSDKNVKKVDEGATAKRIDQIEYTEPGFSDVSPFHKINGELDGIIDLMKSPAIPPSPISNASPTQVISQKVEQNVDIHLEMIIDLTSLLEKNRSKYPEDSKQHKFIDNLKEKIKKIKNGMDVVKTIISVGKEAGITVTELLELLS